jgi:hypothetical protein
VLVLLRDKEKKVKSSKFSFLKENLIFVHFLSIICILIDPFRELIGVKSGVKWRIAKKSSEKLIICQSM